MKQITIYTTGYCPYCHSAKRLLKEKGLDYSEIELDDKPELRDKISKENGNYKSVPMIFIDETFIGGFSDLQQLAREGKL